MPLRNSPSISESTAKQGASLCWRPVARGSVFYSPVQPFPPGPKITDPGPPVLLLSVGSDALVVEGTVELLLYGDLVGAVAAPGPDTSSGEGCRPCARISRRAGRRGPVAAGL